LQGHGDDRGAEGGALPDRLSGREILLYLGLLRGMSREVVLQRADELLRVLELGGAEGTPVVGYSTGMRKRSRFWWGCWSASSPHSAARPRACRSPAC
jgi:hypothetical protein